VKLARHLRATYPILLATIALVGCIASSTPTPTLTPVPRLTLDLLKNADYRLSDRQIRLTNGIYQERVGFVTPTVQLWDHPLAFADLNSDGVEDAVGILENDGGGSAQVRILVVVLNQDGIPKHVANAGLGDRTKVKNIRVDGKTITLDVVTHRPEDGLCCPTLDATWQFRFEDNKLALLQ